MKVTPITEATARQQANSFLWVKGPYDFTVSSAIEKLSRAGNDMIELEHVVYNEEGKHRKIKDWLLEGEYTSYKVRHFAAAVGLLAEYERGELKAADLADKSGRLKLGIQRAKEGDAYGDQNRVDDYLPGGATNPAPSTADPALDDEIPF